MDWTFELLAGPYGGTTEGPAWDGHDSLYFTNDQQITRRDSNGKFHVFRKPSNARSTSRRSRISFISRSAFTWAKFAARNFSPGWRFNSAGSPPRMGSRASPGIAGSKNIPQSEVER